MKVYPSTRYHPAHGAVVVADPSHEATAAPVENGWTMSPADFPEVATVAPAKKAAKK